MTDEKNQENDAVEAAGDAGAAEEAGTPFEVVSVADARERASAGSLAGLALPAPMAGASVPPAPGKPPAGYLQVSARAPEALPDADVAEAPEPVASDAQPPSERRTRPEGPEPASSLTSDRLIEKAAAPPEAGWRLWLYRATLGYVNLGDPDHVRLRRALEHRIATRLGERTRFVPVLSRKGGVGKTTVTTLLGMALADLREDRVIALDANPDRGTLSDRNPGRATHTARHLVKDRFSVDSFAQLSEYTAREGSRLDVLASDPDPMVAHAFDDGDYRAVTDVLGRYYSIVLTDSGTGMVHSVMKGTLEKADAVVLVSGGSVDEARLASETLTWLEAHGREDLVKKAIVVINLGAGEGTRVDVDEIEEHFRTRVAHVLRIPHDRHLAEGSQIEFGKLRQPTRAAATELAALVVDELVG
ncbi:MinD/ParA family ATP-binding protein [Sinomonas humi]|uniref:MinD/ParA family ATP-binding protein n=1 Tax=Sinomonas humi TaxID=1338436 RepID=UPI0009DEE431|nr:MinD/ParA family protein [Sinomonas humi]